MSLYAKKPMTFDYSENDMLIEAVEHYIYSIKECNANQAEIDAYTKLLTELESNKPIIFGPTGLRGDPA